MNKLEATVRLKCPRCHEGEMFENKNFLHKLINFILIIMLIISFMVFQF